MDFAKNTSFESYGVICSPQQISMDSTALQQQMSEQEEVRMWWYGVGWVCTALQSQ